MPGKRKVKSNELNVPFSELGQLHGTMAYLPPSRTPEEAPWKCEGIEIAVCVGYGMKKLNFLYKSMVM